MADTSNRCECYEAATQRFEVHSWASIVASATWATQNDTSILEPLWPPML
jgi:hypothetical protein